MIVLPSVTDFVIRRVRDGEASLLSALSIRSKSYWPYDEEYLELCRGAIHVTAEDIQGWPFLVAEQEGETLCGFAAICEVKGEKMLDHLWIDPPFIGKGLGRKLFLESLREAAALGWGRLTIAADPFAEGFYLNMGTKRIGEWESKLKKAFFFRCLKSAQTHSFESWPA